MRSQLRPDGVIASFKKYASKIIRCNIFFASVNRSFHKMDAQIVKSILILIV